MRREKLPSIGAGSEDVVRVGADDASAFDLGGTAVFEIVQLTDLLLEFEDGSCLCIDLSLELANEIVLGGRRLCLVLAFGRGSRVATSLGDLSGDGICIDSTCRIFSQYVDKKR